MGLFEIFYGDYVWSGLSPIHLSFLISYAFINLLYLIKYTDLYADWDSLPSG